jgi:hypothetical protein
MKYTSEQHKKYLAMTRQTGIKWLDVFEDNTDYYATYYWDLLTEMWYKGKPVMVSEAIKYMRSIKSPFTARKYLQKAIDGGIIVESKNPADDRSTLVELNPKISAKLDEFFDYTLTELAGFAGKNL